MERKQFYIHTLFTVAKPLKHGTGGLTMRMIDGDRIAELFETAAKRGGGVLATVYRDAAHLARTAPTIEAAKIVYCGDCKYMQPDGHCTQFADDRIKPSASDFCSAGERKEVQEDA